MIITKTKFYEPVLVSSGLMSMKTHEVDFDGEFGYVAGSNGIIITSRLIGVQFFNNPLDAIARIDNHNKQFMKDINDQLGAIDVYLDGVYRLAINREKQYA